MSFFSSYRLEQQILQVTVLRAQWRRRLHVRKLLLSLSCRQLSFTLLRDQARYEAMNQLVVYL
jgi:hypothetical protein